jgi:hypothetical protein
MAAQPRTPARAPTKAPAPAPAPIPAAATLPALITLARQLSDLLERETALVRAMKIAEVAPLQTEKLRLTELFQTALKSLDPTAFATLPAALKKEWRAAGTKLSEATVENERALRVGRIATERLVTVIVQAVEKSRPSTSGYTARRKTPDRQPRVSGLAVDHRT